MSAILPTNGAVPVRSCESSHDVISLGVVSYLNTIPLTAGLEHHDSIELLSDVPAAQIDLIQSGRVDLALCSVVNVARSEVPLQIVPVGMLGCAGKTMTVRLFSRVPLHEVTRVHCDTDSHTSVALMEVLLRELHGIQPELVPFQAQGLSRIDVADAAEMESLLLIGDKVVTSDIADELSEHQIDLGEAWFEMTGLPFVFATWICPAELTPEQSTRVHAAAQVLNDMRQHNSQRLPELAAHYAPQFGWPEDLARQYMTELLRYDLDDRAIQGMRRFIELSSGSADSIRLLDWT